MQDDEFRGVGVLGSSPWQRPRNRACRSTRSEGWDGPKYASASVIRREIVEVPYWACIWKQSGGSTSTRTTDDRQTDDLQPPLGARIEASAFCQGIAYLADVLRSSSVLRIRSATFVDVRVGWCTTGVREPHCNTNLSALPHGRCHAWVRHSSDPTVGPAQTTGIPAGKDSKCCRRGKNHADTQGFEGKHRKAGGVKETGLGNSRVVSL
jgi:hypothetical protein